MNLIFGALIWLPLAIWILSLVQWTIQGEVDGLTGFLGIATAALMGYFCFTPPHPILPPVLFGVAVVAVLFYPLIRSQMDRRAMIAIDIGQIERAYEQIRERPDNVGARLKLARLLYPRGLGGHCIAIAEQAVAGMPRDMFEEEFRQIDNWKSQLGNPTRFRSVPCLECGIPNEPGNIYCKKCKAPYLLHHAKGKFLGPNLARRAVAVLGVIVMLLVGIPWSMHHLTGIKPLIAIFGQVVLSGGVLYTVFLSRRKR